MLFKILIILTKKRYTVSRQMNLKLYDLFTQKFMLCDEGTLYHFAKFNEFNFHSIFLQLFYILQQIYMNLSKISSQILNLLFPFIIVMKTGFVLLAGVMALEASATLNLDIGGCKVQKKIQRDQLECPCTGGSGNYDWHFKDLPEDWKAQNGKLFSQKGKFDNKKIYGAKLQLFDKNTKQAIKKSLFFNFQNGSLQKVLDQDADFNVKDIIDVRTNNQGNNFGLWGRAQNGLAQRFRKFFDNVKGIGGGCGLNLLRPFFGGRGLYKDEGNPYLNNIPNENAIQIAIQSGRSTDIRQLVVNTVQSKNQCRVVAKFLQKIFLNYRRKIAVQKDEVQTAQKVLKSTQEQISFIEKELQKAAKNEGSVRQYVAQLQDLRNQAAQIVQDRNKFQTTLKQANQQIEVLQIEITKNLEISRRLKQEDSERTQKIQKIDQDIANLEAKVQKLKDQKATLLNQDGQKEKLAEANKKVEEIKVKLEAVRITISDIKTKIKQLNQNYESVQTKISTTDKNLKAAGGEQNIQNLKTKLVYYKERLQQFKSNLIKIEPIYKDYSSNYDDIVKIKDSQFDSCYKNLFNDSDGLFEEDNQDGVRFNGKQNLGRYIQKIYGKQLRDWSGTVRDIKDQSQRKFFNIKNDVWKLLPQPGSFNQNPFFPDAKDLIPTKINQQKYNQNDNENIRVKRTHIFSPAWTKAHGSPYDDNFDQNRGRRFAEQDQQCDINGLIDTNAFSGKVVSINKNVAKVINDQGEVCTLYLGGCTRIEAVNKPIPQAGDYVYWKGKQKRAKQFNTLQMTCL